MAWTYYLQLKFATSSFGFNQGASFSKVGVASGLTCDILVSVYFHSQRLRQLSYCAPFHPVAFVT